MAFGCLRTCGVGGNMQDWAGASKGKRGFGKSVFLSEHTRNRMAFVHVVCVLAFEDSNVVAIVLGPVSRFL